MRALDLFCGAGGASRGLALAGFDVTGVDNRPQPNYPYPLIVADAMTFPLEGYDLIWASPPCQAYSWASAHLGERYKKLVPAVRIMLQKAGTPYIIENVVGAPMIRPITLCGRMFDLALIRHRQFESNLPIRAPKHKPHGGTVKNKDFVCVAGHGGSGRRALHLWKSAMGIDWMTENELTQAIPPIYSQYLAQQVLRRWLHSEASSTTGS